MSLPRNDLVVLLIGSGGREHAFAWKLAKSGRVKYIYCVPGNGGTAKEHLKISNIEGVESQSFDDVLAAARAREVNLVIPSAEGPLVDGFVDKFLEAGIFCFGPTSAAAQLEGSKAFAKDFMVRYGIPTASHQSFTSVQRARDYLKSAVVPQVLKASGLAAGKGVMMPTTKQDELDALEEMMVRKIFGDSANTVVIEERLVGDEISIVMISDGHSIKVFPAAQDHQRIYDENEGPNTGGMGCYAPTVLCSPEDLVAIETQILQPTIDGMRSEGTPFIGLICIGVILTAAGPKNLEYNVRFGDPEAQILLPFLSSNVDLVDILHACLERRLADCHWSFQEGFTANVVLASEGYPLEYNIGKRITFGDTPPGTLLFQAGTRYDHNNQLITDGGRVIAACAFGSTLEETVNKAYKAAASVRFDGKYQRGDIARKAIEMERRTLKLTVEQNELTSGECDR